MSLPLYLASRSPRRKELLSKAGIRFRVHVPSENELDAPRFRKETPARVIVRRISSAKAHAAVKELRARGVKRAIVLSADTLVFQRQHVLGKPRDATDARRMLRALSGTWHEVFTGVTVLRMEPKALHEHALEVRSRVKFFSLKKAQIEWYVKTGEPLDKAGSYGAQGYGAALVEKFDGSYTNVVGLPLGETLALLEKAASPKPRVGRAGQRKVARGQRKVARGQHKVATR